MDPARNTGGNTTESFSTTRPDHPAMNDGRTFCATSLGSLLLSKAKKTQGAEHEKAGGGGRENEIDHLHAECSMIGANNQRIENTTLRGTHHSDARKYAELNRIKDPVVSCKYA